MMYLCTLKYYKTLQIKVKSILAQFLKKFEKNKKNTNLVVLIACLFKLQLLIGAQKFINHFLDIAIHKARHIIN